MIDNFGFAGGLAKGKGAPPDQVGSSSKSSRACIRLRTGSKIGSFLVGVMGCDAFIKAILSCTPDSLLSSAAGLSTLERFPHSTKIKIAQARMIAPPTEATTIMIVRSSSAELVLLVGEIEV